MALLSFLLSTSCRIRMCVLLRGSLSAAALQNNFLHLVILCSKAIQLFKYLLATSMTQAARMSVS